MTNRPRPRLQLPLEEENRLEKHRCGTLFALRVDELRLGERLMHGVVGVMLTGPAVAGADEVQPAHAAFV